MHGTIGQLLHNSNVVFIPITPEIARAAPKQQLIFNKMLQHVCFGANMKRLVSLLVEIKTLPPHNMKALQTCQEFVHALATRLNLKRLGGTSLGVLNHAFEEVDEMGEMLLSSGCESVGVPEAEGWLVSRNRGGGGSPTPTQTRRVALSGLL